MVYFEHEGPLPAPGILNLSPGRSYTDANLFRPYYNAGRWRIDHFSTYIVMARRRNLGSEPKDNGGAYAAAPGGNLTVPWRKRRWMRKAPRFPLWWKAMRRLRPGRGLDDILA